MSEKQQKHIRRGGGGGEHLLERAAYWKEGSKLNHYGVLLYLQSCRGVGELPSPPGPRRQKENLV